MKVLAGESHLDDHGPRRKQLSTVNGTEEASTRGYSQGVTLLVPESHENLLRLCWTASVDAPCPRRASIMNGL